MIDRLASDAEARTDACVAEMQRGHQSALAETQQGHQSALAETQRGYHSALAETQRGHQSALAALQLRLDEQALELEARAEALDQLTDSLGEAKSRLDLQRREFDVQRSELEGAQRHLATANTSELVEMRTALESSQAEVERLNRQFETALDDLRAEHLATLQEQALARTILPLDELLTVFDALTTASTPSAVLTAVVSGLSREFSRVALFRLRSSRLECVSHAGFEFEGDIAKVVIPVGVDSLMTRALSSRSTQTFVSGTSDEPCTAPFGGTPACAVALPLVSGDATVAVIYADDSDQLEFGSVPSALLVKFAELVWQHAILALQRASGAQKTLAVKPFQRFDRLA